MSTATINSTRGGPVPTLDAIAADPYRAAGLPKATISALLLRAAIVQSALTAQLITKDVDAPPVGATEDEMLTPIEAAVILKQSRRWLTRNARRLPFVRRISERSFLCSKQGIAKWLASRKV
jgi:hypothetical protein